MKRYIQYLVLIIINFFFVLDSSAQNWDKIFLKAGAVKEGTIEPKIQDYNSIERVNFLNETREKKSIPIKAIKQIVLSNGEIVFPIPDKKVAQDENKNSSSLDEIILKTGKSISCILILKGNSIQDLQRVAFKDVEGSEKSIPKAAISKIIDKKGSILYPIDYVNINENLIEEVDSLLIKPRVEKKKEQPKFDCKKESLSLKLAIEKASLERYNEIQDEIKNQTSAFKNANSAMEEKVRNQVYTGIRYDVEELNQFTTSVDAVITIEVDSKGKLIDHVDKVNSYQELRNYTKLRDTKIYPFLERKIYPTAEVAIDYSGEYEKLYKQFETKINESKCPEEFDEVLSLAESRFKSIDSKFMNTNTIYTIPIKYNFSRVIQKWTYFNEDLKIKSKPNFITITNRDTKKQFLSKLKYKQLNGKYQVNVSYFSLLEDSAKITVNHVRRKYKYLTHFGVSTFAHINIPLNTSFSKNFQHPIGDVFTFNLNIVLHRIGFFGGTMYNFDQSTTVKDGLYLGQNFPTYGEGGLYIGLAQYFYLKMGYSYLKTDLHRFDNNLLVNTYENEINHGFIAGMALMFPYVDVQWGYNSNLNSFYAGLGLHVTLNK